MTLVALEADEIVSYHHGEAVDEASRAYWIDRLYDVLFALCRHDQAADTRERLTACFERQEAQEVLAELNAILELRIRT